MAKKGLQNEMLVRTSDGLLIAGGLNWGILGALDMNVLSMLLSTWSWLLMLVYILVGLAAVHKLALMFMK